ncbi:MAG: hypothetical protein ACTHKH_21910 [Trinickia sp.]|jgi:hypothetical protein
MLSHAISVSFHRARPRATIAAVVRMPHALTRTIVTMRAALNAPH